MNKCYRLVFNRCTQVWQVVAENVSGRGRCGYKLMAAAALAAALPLAQAADPMGITELPGTTGFGTGNSAYATGISADGSTIIGEADNDDGDSRAVYWNSTGMASLGALRTNSGDRSYAKAVNKDGTVIVGYSTGPAGDMVAFLWDGSAMHDLGTLETPASTASFHFSAAYGVNADGTVVVGQATNDDGETHAFRWEATPGMTQLFTEVDGVTTSESSANAVNAAGNVVVGEYRTASTDVKAFRWAEVNGVESVQSLGALDDDVNTSWRSVATAVNADGDVVAGWSTNGTDSSAPVEAFRWTVDGMVGLGVLSGYTNSYAAAINGSGNVIVGTAENVSGSEPLRGFRWEAGIDMQTIEQWLEASGVDTSALTEYAASATGVNEDGSIVVGTLSNNRAYVARGATGMIDLASYNASLGRVAASVLLAENQNDLVFHGMHGNPMQMLLKNGKSSFWVGGDAGRQDREARKGDVAIGEIGYAHRFSDTVQVNVAAGHSYSSAKTDFGGKTRVEGDFVLPEVIVSLPNSTYATISGFYGAGTADVRRGYINTGVQTYSEGSADTESLGLRLRLDWHEMADINGVTLTPYVGLSYLQTTIDAYAETGGGFPVNWDKRKEKATTARAGVDAAKVINETVKLTGRLEGVHRFEDKNEGATGRVTGMGNFSFAGQNLKQTWLRAGAGVESKLGSGIASATVNATTEGEAAAYWLAVNYRWEF